MIPASHIILPHLPLALTSYPDQPRLALGLAEGGVTITQPLIHDPHAPPARPKITHPFPTSCRQLSFTPHTNLLVVAPSAPQLLLYDAHRPHPTHIYNLPGQDEDSDVPSATSLTCLDENTIIAGDDSGGLHLFDVRTADAPVASVLEQGDYISSLCPVEQFNTKAILASSGDGTLCAYDMRVPPLPRLRLQYACDSFNDDLLSLAVLHAAPFAVAGTLSGALNIYNLRFLDKTSLSDAAEHVDRFYGHPECVNAIIPFADGVVLTASSDGIVRVVDVLERILVGVLPYEYEQVEEGEESGEQGDRDRAKMKKPQWPVEDMVRVQGWGKPGFALLGHDHAVRFCDGAPLVDDEPDVEEKDGETEELLGEAREEFESSRRKKKRKASSKGKATTVPKDFFDDL